MSNTFTHIGTFFTLREACESAGVQYREIHATGRFFRSNLIDGGKGDASIKLFSDGNGGMVFNQRDKTMAFFFLGYKDQRLTAAQNIQIKKAIEEAKAQFDREERERHERAAFTAMKLIDHAKQAQKHPYLERKHVKHVPTLLTIPASAAMDIVGDYYEAQYHYRPKTLKGTKGRYLRLNEDWLLVPMRGASAAIQTVQIIDSAGSKAFLSGGKASGSYWQADELPECDLDTTMTIGIGEGVATVLSVRQVKNFPVIAAMSCGNLKAVALNVRARFPRSKILILSDVGNGEKEAFEATQAVNGQLAIPKFTDALRADFKRLTGKDNPTDFNDYYLAKGEI